MDKAVTEAINFDSNVFNIDTIKRAAYRFSDRFATNIALNGSLVVCELTFPNTANEDLARIAIADFQKEVLDQDLRRTISDETAAYRNAILALAFSSSKLTKDE